MTFVRKLHRGISNSSPPTRYARPPRSAWQEGGLVRGAEDAERGLSPASLEFTETSETNPLSDFLRGEIRQNTQSADGGGFVALQSCNVRQRTVAMEQPISPFDAE